MESRPIRITRTSVVAARSEPQPRALLQEAGRVLTAEVVKIESDGSYELAVGRERVRVESQRMLNLGDTLEVRVERDGKTTSLVALETRAPEKSVLLQFLRAQGAPKPEFGQVLGELIQTLQSVDSEGETRAALVKTLTSRIVGSEPSGARLASLLSTSGSDFEPRLFQLATSESSAPAPEQLITDTVTSLIERLAPTPAIAAELQAQFGPQFELHLKAHVAQESATVGEGLTRANLRRFFASYARELTSVIARSVAKDADAVQLRAQLLTGLKSMAQKGESARFLEPLLRRLLGSHDPQVRAQLLGLLRDDLKGQLLTFLAGEAQAGDGEQVDRVLKSIEREQVRNLARAENGEGRQWTLAMADGAELATLKLFRRDEESNRTDAREAGARFTLGVELSKLGPIRADLSLGKNSLAVRVTSSEVATTAMLRADSGTLTRLLEATGKEVTLAIVQGTDEQASVEDLERELRFVDEHHLLDLSA